MIRKYIHFVDSEGKKCRVGITREQESGKYIVAFTVREFKNLLDDLKIKYEVKK